MKQQILQSALDRLREAWLEIDKAQKAGDRVNALGLYLEQSRKVLGHDIYNVFPDRDKDR